MAMILQRANILSKNIKIGEKNDFCFICLNKLEKINSLEKEKLIGVLENKPVFFIKRHGLQTCICMDCMKKIYENEILPLFPKKQTDDKDIENDTQDKDAIKNKKATKNK